MSLPADENLVPKVHPLDRLAAPEDPLELMAEPAPGDPAVMLDCLVQEFLWMGWQGDDLMGLFHDPNYPVLNQLRRHFGEDFVRARLAEIASHWGGLRISETIVEDDLPSESEFDLVQLTLPAGFAAARLETDPAN